MGELLLAAVTALWLGVLCSLSPCPLATNVAAVAYLGRHAATPRRVLGAGLLYTAGRALTYVALGALLVGGLLAAPRASAALQGGVNRVLGPILILVGMVVLGLLPLPSFGRGVGHRTQERLAAFGPLGALALGALFALAFCPVSAALFFGSLLPLAIRTGSAVIPSRAAICELAS